ncbi:NUDIX hydrolase [Streptacidiphilus sp. MAP12-20]|uniref:NUDIX hydrolase n=1 Tax=Streptacidiphilus sp. MAP12-20 TaxID=3156299 RepID=UPI0035169963
MDVVKAAGVVLWRERRKSGDGVEIALVHRAKYDDWSFPKGKLEIGERHREAALREAFEETGMKVLLGQRLPTQHYLVRDRVKRVRYWSATRLTGRFVPNREVDELCWLPAAEARAKLSYEHDRALVDALLEQLGA